MTTTIRVSLQTRSILNSLAQAAGVSMQEVIERALELYRRTQMLEQINLAYAALRNDSGAWEAAQTEQRTWDGTLNDGLEDY